MLSWRPIRQPDMGVLRMHTLVLKYVIFATSYYSSYFSNVCTAESLANVVCTADIFYYFSTTSFRSVMFRNTSHNATTPQYHSAQTGERGQPSSSPPGEGGIDPPPCPPKIMIWRIFSQDYHFFRGCKNCTSKKQKHFFDFLFKKK